MPLSLPLFRKIKAHTPGAAELLAQARALQAERRLAAAEVAAGQALVRQERAVGHQDSSLVPYLLACAGIAYQLHGWAHGRHYYDRAQALRGPAPRRGARPSAPPLPARG